MSNDNASMATVQAMLDAANSVAAQYEAKLADLTADRDRLRGEVERWREGFNREQQVACDYQRMYAEVANERDSLQRRLDAVVAEVRQFATEVPLDINAHHRIRQIADRGGKDKP